MSWASASASTLHDPELVRQAFVHSSYLNENPGAVVGHNERLEFYGDAVIGLTVSRLLYDRYPDEDEGFLTARRAALVNREALAAMALDLGFDRYLHLGRGESDGGGATRPSLLAASFEALAGAALAERGTRDDDWTSSSRLFEPRVEALAEIAGPPKSAKSTAPGVEPAAPVASSRSTAWSGTSGPPHQQEFEIDVDPRWRVASALGIGLEPAASGGAAPPTTPSRCSTRTTSAARATMSRLKELRLHGFKSFADPTRFVFEPGVNAVIGPNGSGKSNMADAVRWVLGEQSNRSLRTRRADDVIFAGSEQRRAQGMAEAILTLDNADGWLPIEFSEVAIGRRAYRSGDSEYLINGARARLRDVIELLGEGRLGANELVVVGQGTVDAALSLRPEERRQLFEEAAGVKGLQVRRNEASVRLTRGRSTTSRASTTSWPSSSPRSDALRCRPSTSSSTTRSGRGRGRWSSRRTTDVSVAARAAPRRGSPRGSGWPSRRWRRSARRRTRRRDARSRAAEERYWQAEEAAREAARRREATREALIRSEGRLEAIDARLRELVGAIERTSNELARRARALDDSDDEAGAQASAAVSRAAAAEEAWRAAVAELADCG